MDDSRNSESVAGPGLRTPSVRREENVGAVVGISLLAGLIGGVIGYLARFADSGDEPPIRVKNGSMQFQLLGNDKWKPKDSGKYWVMKNGKERSQNRIQLTAAYNGVSCQNTASGDAVKLIFSDESYVTVTAVDKKTRVEAQDPARFDDGTDKKNLIYNGNGYIKSIVVDGTTLCNFASEDQLTHLLLLDYQD
jgi:hypothetical protein